MDGRCRSAGTFVLAGVLALPGELYVGPPRWGGLVRGFNKGPGSDVTRGPRAAYRAPRAAGTASAGPRSMAKARLDQTSSIVCQPGANDGPA
jgi:hypothetical protein